jgi:hypothetical protein
MCIAWGCGEHAGLPQTHFLLTAQAVRLFFDCFTRKDMHARFVRAALTPTIIDVGTAVVRHTRVDC